MRRGAGLSVTAAAMQGRAGCCLYAAVSPYIFIIGETLKDADGTRHCWRAQYADLFRFGCRVLRGFDPDHVPLVPPAEARELLDACPP